MTIVRGKLERFCRVALGYYSNTITTGAESAIDDIVHSAIMAFFMPAVIPGERSAHIWSFLYRYDSIFTDPPYSTGTIGVTGTAVTGVGTVFPANAASATLIVNDEMYEVASRGSDTGLVLKRAVDETIADGTSYELAWINYGLPQQFAGSYGPVTFAPGVGKGPVQQTSAANIEILHQNSGTSYGCPEYISFDSQVRGSLPANVANVRKIRVWPIPDKRYQLSFKYIQHSLGDESASDGSTSPLEVDTNSYLSLIPDYHQDTLYAALSVRLSEMFGVGEINGARQYFQQRMQDSILFDRTLQSSTVGDFIGYNGDSSDSRYGRQTSDLYKSEITATKYSDPLGLGRLL